MIGENPPDVMKFSQLMSRCRAGGFGGSAAGGGRPPRRPSSQRQPLPGGELINGVRTIHLEVGQGQWHPGSADGEGRPHLCLRGNGRALANPRARDPRDPRDGDSGYRCIIHLKSRLRCTDCTNDLATIRARLGCKPGATQEIRFPAGSAGAHTTTGRPQRTIPSRRGPAWTRQLSGALVIDPPGAIGDDRIFVLGLWFKPVYRAVTKPVDYREIATINGRAWPYTERLIAHRADTVHWRWINTSVSGHGMHLHGFYFHLDATGDGEKDQVYSGEAQPLIVTHHVRRGLTFDMSWTPERAGKLAFSLPHDRAHVADAANGGDAGRGSCRSRCRAWPGDGPGGHGRYGARDYRVAGCGAP